MMVKREADYEGSITESDEMIRAVNFRGVVRKQDESK